MTKDEYFQQKHAEIAKQFGVSPKAIEGLRSLAIGKKYTRGQILMILNMAMDKTRVMVQCKFCHGTGRMQGPQRPRKVHAEQFRLIKNATERDWKDITFPYIYEE